MSSSAQDPFYIVKEEIQESVSLYILLTLLFCFSVFRILFLVKCIILFHLYILCLQCILMQISFFICGYLYLID